MFKFIKSLLLLVCLAGVLAAATAFDAQRLLHRPLRLTEITRVTVEKGASLQSSIDQLRAAGAFTNPRQWRYLMLYARYTKAAARIKAGDFDIAPGANSLDALNVLVQGKAVMSELRIPEGWRFDQAITLIRSHPDISQTLPETASAADIMRAVGSPGVMPEGQLFPDTYRFTKGMRDVDLLRHAHHLLKKMLAEEWQARAPGLAYASANEALILASIVEKETGLAADRTRIAGVFLRRLATGMLLQTDPSVIYGLGPNFDGNLRKIDLLTDTPYNSYTRSGLPPSAICLPSRASVHAALHPLNDGSIYFVAKGDGSSAFSKTLEEHNAAVRQYQLKH